MTGAQFEIRIDGTLRSYRDRKDYAMEAARLIKCKNPQSTWSRSKTCEVETLRRWLSGRGKGSPAEAGLEVEDPELA
jgi:hypothetical protein